VAGAWAHLTIRLGSSRDVNILLIQLKRIGDLILTASDRGAARAFFDGGNFPGRIPRLP